MPGKHREVPIFPEDGDSQKGGQRWATMGPHHMVARPTPSPRRHMVWRPWPTTDSPPSRTSSPRNPKTRGAIEEIFCRLHETENNRERKLSGSEKSAGEIPSRRGEIIAIATVIELDFIGIVIIISIVISTAPLRSDVTSRVESCLFHRGNFPGVKYSLWLMLLSETVALRFMSRLLFIIISPLIMIHMKSCE